MYQCVPSWDLDDPVGGAGLNPVSAGAHRLVSGAGDFTPVIVPMSDQYYEVAELTWEKGNISSRGLLNRPVPKYPSASSHLQAIGSSGGGDRETLEAVVGEAAARSAHLAHPVPAPWLGVASAPVDALVPCARDEAEGEARRSKRARVLGEDGRVCASQGSAAPGRGDGESTLLTLEATGADDLCGFTTTTNYSTSLEREDKGSPETENTSIGGGASDSRCFSRRSQRDGLCDEGNNVVIKGEAAVRSPSTSTKRSRAAAIHNESERKRRDRINQKMKTLQKLVPNSSKTDKASMLDEAVDYLKQLQAQVQVMSRMSSMMMPMAMPQLQMSVMANMAQMAQMGLGMMNMGCPGQPGYAGLTPAMNMMHPPPFVPVSWDAAAAARPQQPAGSAVPDALSAFLACQVAQQNAQQQQQQQQQQQPNSMEAYNRMVALYQKLNHQQQQQFSQPSNSKQ